MNSFSEDVSKKFGTLYKRGEKFIGNFSLALYEQISYNMVT